MPSSFRVSTIIVVSLPDGLIPISEVWFIYDLVAMSQSFYNIIFFTVEGGKLCSYILNHYPLNQEEYV